MDRSKFLWTSLAASGAVLVAGEAAAVAKGRIDPHQVATTLLAKDVPRDDRHAQLPGQIGRAAEH